MSDMFFSPYVLLIFYLLSGLPDWFVKEEEMHMRKEPELDPETVAKYK